MPLRLVVGLAVPLLACGAASAAEPAEGGYAVVASKATQSDREWNQVVRALVTKHRAKAVAYDAKVSESLGPLRKAFPRYVCFVARPEEAGRDFVAEVHRLTRQLDDDPYADCFWGIVTGYDAAAALRTAEHSEPLTVRKVAAGTELAMDMVDEGVWYCELNKGKMVKKEKGGDAKVLKGPEDTTRALVDALNTFRAEMFVTSGHATERDWAIGFRYRNGSFRHEQGRLFGLDTQGKQFPVDSPNPKVYLPVGNCLMGHVDRADCMATAWMNGAGVVQMTGYTVPTWYGYMGWGVLDYFLEQPGRFTLAEAFFANHHALTHRLAAYFPEMLAASAADGRTAARPALSAAAKAAGLTLNDARGLAFDRDAVAFYGDPAWQARMADRPKAFEQKLSRQGRQYVFEIAPNRGAESFKPVNANGSQRGGRPFVAFLPHRIRDAAVLEGTDLGPLITDDFVLVPNPRQCEPGRKYRVVFEGAPR